jgi:hypothetical protein
MQVKTKKVAVEVGAEWLHQQGRAPNGKLCRRLADARATQSGRRVDKSWRAT